MLSIDDLPAVNASLNAVAAMLLIVGRRFVRRGHVRAHRRTMIAAFVTSCLFFASYITYHAHAGSHPFPGHGPVRTAYLVMLTTHVVLAAAIVPLAITTLVLGLRRRDRRHRRLARWTWPLWLYVSVTGVAIYVILYVIY
jgi:putative membrane protein